MKKKKRYKIILKAGNKSVINAIYYRLYIVTFRTLVGIFPGY